jgi:hypothetical protein
MKSKNLLIVVILICLSMGLKAQDKYEQAVIAQGVSIKGYVLYVSMEVKNTRR